MHQRSDRTTGTRGLMGGWHTEQVAESQAGHDQAGLKNVAKKRVFHESSSEFFIQKS